MTRQVLMEIAAEAYGPDGVVDCYDPETDSLVPVDDARELSRDRLAEYIAHEIYDSFDEDLEDHEQLELLHQVLGLAASDLRQVVLAFERRL